MGGVRSTGVRGSRRDGGASLVEFALVAPLFLLLLFGMISTGIALNEKQQMTHAVREGARYGAAIPATELPGNTFAETVRNQVVFRSDGLFEPDDARICVSLVRGSPASSDVVSSTHGFACNPSETYPVSGSDTGQRVQVSATRDSEIELLVRSIEVEMNTSATAKSEYDS